MTYNSHKFIQLDSIAISVKTKELLKQAEKIYHQNFDGKTWYGRCIFLSWYCSIGDCKFCFRTTQKHKIKHPEKSRRSVGSALIEALFCKVFNWRIEFLTGGYGILPFPELLEIIKNVSIVYENKIWLNLGIISENHLEQVKPYVKGICASMETLTPKLHEYVCPNKPLEPYDRMFSQLKEFKKSIAVIVGLGDKINDIAYLFNFVEKHNLDRVTMYALKPVKDTEYVEGPSVDEYLQWLAKLRIRFPKLEIIAGTNLRRCEESGYLMRAGVNAITKFPATKQFGTEKAKLVETIIKKENRNFVSILALMPEIDWDEKINELNIEEKYKNMIRKKLPSYLDRFNRKNKATEIKERKDE